MKRHCCERMADHVDRECDQHPNVFDCPDRLIHYSAASGEYGVIVHDGGSSHIVINYCPWCGTRLPGDAA